MTRAREGQWLRETPATTPAKPRPKAREMSMTSRTWGMPQKRSMHQEITASARRPRAAATPSKTERRALTAAVIRPMRMLRESPVRVRASISRPIQSVPNQWPGPGASCLLEKFVSMARGWRKRPAAVTAHRRRAAHPSRARVRVR